MTSGMAIIGLDNPKCPANVGGAMRAAHAFRAAAIAVSGTRFNMTRIPTDVNRAYRMIPTLRVEDIFDALPLDCVPVAVDLVPGAVSLYDYVHPKRAFYIFGAEDATLGSRITGRCRDKVMIPTQHCLNLAATVNVVLYDRARKIAEKAATAVVTTVARDTRSTGGHVCRSAV